MLEVDGELLGRPPNKIILTTVLQNRENPVVKYSLENIFELVS